MVGASEKCSVSFGTAGYAKEHSLLLVIGVDDNKFWVISDGKVGHVYATSVYPAVTAKPHPDAAWYK